MGMMVTVRSVEKGIQALVYHIEIRAWDWTFVSLDVQVKMGLDPHVQLSACTRTRTRTPYVG